MKLVFPNYRNPRHLEFNMPFESFRNFRNAKKYEKKDSAGSGRPDKKEKKNKKDKKEKKRKAAEEEDDDDEDEEEEKPKPRARKTDGKAKAKVKSKGKKWYVYRLGSPGLLAAIPLYGLWNLQDSCILYKCVYRIDGPAGVHAHMRPNQYTTHVKPAISSWQFHPW